MTTRSLDLSKYPSIYIDLFTTVAQNNGHRISDLPTKQKAIDLRRELYFFRRAATAEGLPEARHWNSFVLSIEQNPNSDTWSIIFRNPDERPIVNFVKNSL